MYRLSTVINFLLARNRCTVCDATDTVRMDCPAGVRRNMYTVPVALRTFVDSTTGIR